MKAFFVHCVRFIGVMSINSKAILETRSAGHGLFCTPVYAASIYDDKFYFCKAITILYATYITITSEITALLKFESWIIHNIFIILNCIGITKPKLFNRTPA